MESRDIAGLKRKHAATEEPAKKAELAQKLRLMGHDPEDEEKGSEAHSDAPKDRRAPEKVTAEQKRPAAKAAEAKDGDKPKPAARPARASKNAEDK